jgi:dTDP-4-dehydrorhamnose 3,5-epimerase
LKFEKTELTGVYIIEHDVHKDSRGAFVKTFHKEEFNKMGLENDFSESYYTRSKEDVIRGMHFQVPPYDHAKLVTVILGTVVDVILDLRKSSPTKGKHIAVELSRENRKSIYIPRGCAHGFAVLSESAIVFYMATTEHAPMHDKGIRFNSFGYDWRIKHPIISERDLGLPELTKFNEYFP